MFLCVYVIAHRLELKHDAKSSQYFTNHQLLARKKHQSSAHFVNRPVGGMELEGLHQAVAIPVPAVVIDSIAGGWQQVSGKGPSELRLSLNG